MKKTERVKFWPKNS